MFFRDGDMGFSGSTLFANGRTIMMVTRRAVLAGATAVGVGSLLRARLLAQSTLPPLEECSYGQVRITAPLAALQRQNVTDVLLGLRDDSLLQPFRAVAGKDAPGVNIGGWYEYLPDYDFHHGDAGFAPGHALGQWISAMARLSAQDDVRGAELAAKANRLTGQLSSEVTPKFFETTRFPAYTLEKFACGMVDAHRVLGNSTAYDALHRLCEMASPSLPGHAVDREVQWRIGRDVSYTWDENFTLPENLLKAGDDDRRFKPLAHAYLEDAAFFEPLSRGVNLMADRHAYSYVNALCSAMQMYLSTRSEMHLKAAENGFAMLQAQSFATAGWGPDELLRKQGYDEILKTLTASHNTFETPCGSFAHAKLTRYLLRATRDGRYGDSMERVLLNTTAGALPLQADGRSFYYADYNNVAKRVYSVHRWPCCSGTLPQVVADYGINSYFHEPGALWVNLYMPGEVRWTEAGAQLAVAQDGTYPAGGQVRLRVTTSKPIPFALKLRVPEWAGLQELTVNGRTVPVLTDKGFCEVRRVWRTGDTVMLSMAMPLRLEALPANGGPAHPEAVALLYGPLVLFALREAGETGPLAVSREALLKAERSGPAEWTFDAPAGRRRLVPFNEVGDRLYTLYMQAT
jgi:DUF1680 family protein